jgi:hypothetical protein
VVACNDDHLPVRSQGRPQPAEHGLGAHEHLGQRPVAKLEDVAQEDQPVALGDRLGERRLRPGAAQDVDLGAGTEMQVGDDQGPCQVASSPRRKPSPWPGESPWEA